MSDIEAQHAEPAMTGLIRLERSMVLDRKRVHSLALFAFKTAVVFDHIARNRPPFFLKEIRHRFRQDLSIPPMLVQMWMAASKGLRTGEVITFYSEGQIAKENLLKMYVCTYSVGNLVFQVVSQRQQGFTSFGPVPGHEYLSVPFWPLDDLLDNFNWPPSAILRSDDEFLDYATRWRTLSVPPWK